MRRQSGQRLWVWRIATVAGSGIAVTLPGAKAALGPMPAGRGAAWRPVPGGHAGRVLLGDLLGRPDGVAGLGWLLVQQPGALGGGQQAGLDLLAPEHAAGDQAEQPQARGVQAAVAVALGCAGDRGKPRIQGSLPVG